jgi:hypothetical protein
MERQRGREGSKGGLEFTRLSSRPADLDGLEMKRLFDGQTAEWGTRVHSSL